MTMESVLRRFYIPAAALLAALTAAAPARAIYLSEDGGTAFLRGPIDKGDGDVFKEFLERKRAAPLKVIYLDSYGGEIFAGMYIGVQVRRAKLDTAVKAESANCASSCTLIFSAGVRRFNIGGDKITAGLSGFTGLGYHPANTPGDRARFTIKSQVGTDAMAKFYALMGQPAAAAVLSKGAQINTLYRPSGKETLDLRIATSLAPP